MGKLALSCPLMGHETKTQRSQSSALGHTASDSQLYVLFYFMTLFDFRFVSFYFASLHLILLYIIFYFTFPLFLLL